MLNNNSDKIRNNNKKERTKLLAQISYKIPHNGKFINIEIEALEKKLAQAKHLLCKGHKYFNVA